MKSVLLLESTIQRCVDGVRRLPRESAAALLHISRWEWIGIGSSGLILSIPLYFIFRYRRSIRRRVKEVERRLSRGLIYRDPTRDSSSSSGNTTSNKKLVRALELHPPFVEQCQKEGWKLMSLGQYLSTLRVNQLDDDDDDNNTTPIPKLLERELEATIGAALLRNLGPRLGGVLLPMLGISQVDSWIAKVAASIASYVASHILVEVSSDWDPTEDRAAFPLAVSEIVAFANLNQKIRRSDPKKKNKQQEGPASTSTASEDLTTTTTTSLEWMNRGEIGYTPSYYQCATTIHADNNKEDKNDGVSTGDTTTTTTTKSELIPNPFVVEHHFEAAILGLEDCIRAQSTVTDTNPSPNAEAATTTAEYDPEDRSLPQPYPINERVLPGLHMGWGDAQCTHTKREILRNRLLAVLLTKLSYNYRLIEKKDDQQRRGGAAAVEPLFLVDYKGTRCRFPDEFVQALLDNGHTVEICPRSTVTTFGMAACVKEDDGSWTNIPIAFFFRTGYEQKDGKPAYFSAPHGGLDMSITSGPLLGKDGNKCDIQFYVAIEGLCAWHSNHNVDVPWIKPVSTTNLYDRQQSLQAVRMAGLLAVTFNALATEMNLPFGGYGVLGVCNDSAAFVDFAVRGETNMYPLISTGRFLFHSGRRLLELKDSLSKHTGLETVAADLRRLVAAACQMDSDIHNSPSQLIGATRRYLANSPTSYFQLTEDSKNMMTAVAKIYQEYTGVHEQTEEAGETTDSPVANFVNFLFQANHSKRQMLVET